MPLRHGEQIERNLARADRPEPVHRADALVELGLTEAVSDDDVRAAFRARLKEAHPDLNGGTDVLLRRLILARDLLIQDVKSEPEPAAEQKDLTDAAIPLRINLAQALHGGEALLSGVKTLRLMLPAGLRDGERLELPCEGTDATSHLFAINIDPGPGVHVAGDDIWTTAAIEPRVFFSGGRTQIDTPWGPRDIEIGRAFPRGSSLCLKGLGMPATETHPAGHLYVRLEARSEAPRTYSETLTDFRQKWAS